MLQPSPVPATPFAERFRTGAGRRALGLGLTLLIEGLLLLLLLSLGVKEMPGTEEKRTVVVNLSADLAAEEEAEESGAEPEQRAEEPPPQPAEAEQPVSPPVPRPEPLPAAPATIALPPPPPPSPPTPPSAETLPKAVQPLPSPRKAYGPPNKGRSFSSDTERVGTAPNGEPLYAASWYREPREDELRAYLATARGPGWGLIACRTAPNYRVEDCVGLDEYPSGSQITRAVLAAAWEFKVRPPQRGGRPLVGSWVRIRIDYGIRSQ